MGKIWTPEDGVAAPPQQVSLSQVINSIGGHLQRLSNEVNAIGNGMAGLDITVQSLFQLLIDKKIIEEAELKNYINNLVVQTKKSIEEAKAVATKEAEKVEEAKIDASPVMANPWKKES